MYPLNSKSSTCTERTRGSTHLHTFAVFSGAKGIRVHCVGVCGEMSTQVSSAQHGFSELLDRPTAERCKYSTSQFVLEGIKFYCLANLTKRQAKHTRNKWRTVGNIIELCWNHQSPIESPDICVYKLSVGSLAELDMS